MPLDPRHQQRKCTLTSRPYLNPFMPTTRLSSFTNCVNLSTVISSSLSSSRESRYVRMTPRRKGAPSAWKRGVIHCARWLGDGQWIAIFEVVSSVIKSCVNPTSFGRSQCSTVSKTCLSVETHSEGRHQISTSHSQEREGLLTAPYRCILISTPPCGFVSVQVCRIQCKPLGLRVSRMRWYCGKRRSLRVQNYRLPCLYLARHQ